MKRLFAPLSSSLTYTRAVYLVLGFPLGLFYFVFLVTSLSLGVGLAIIWVGLAILFATVLAWRALGSLERGLARTLLGERIESPPAPAVPAGAGYAKRARAIISDSYTWRSFAWLILRFPLGVFGFVFVVTATAVTLSAFAAPAGAFVTDYRIVTDGETLDISWLESIPDWTLWLLPVVGVFLAAASAHAVSGFGRLHGLMARPLLGPSEREQRAALRQRASVLESRTMLAHELHDSLGHTLTMMVVQAGAAGHVFDKDPEFARDALDNIETSGRRALGELDRILGLLRQDGSEDRAPQPGLDRVPMLVEQMAAAGLEIRLTLDGDLDSVPVEVGRFGYRIVQEALTNVLKHAGPVETDVRLNRFATALEIEVTNSGTDGPGQSDPGLTAGGRGLVGVGERVTLLGGRLEAGPLPEGGFRLWAHLPVG